VESIRQAVEVAAGELGAAREGIELTDLEAGPLKVRVRIRPAASNATDARLRELVRRAESRSSVGDELARPVAVTTEVVSRSAGSPAR